MSAYDGPPVDHFVGVVIDGVIHTQRVDHTAGMQEYPLDRCQRLVADMVRELDDTELLQGVDLAGARELAEDDDWPLRNVVI